MKIQKHITLVVILLYIALIYFSPPAYINKPKFLLINIAKFPLTLTNRVFYNLNNLVHSQATIDENKSLRETLDKLKTQLTHYRETELENARLKKLLSFKKDSSLKLVAARVISKDSSNLSDTILISQGSRQGVKKDTVVLAEAGLAGRISESSSSTSRVVLITDPNSRVSALISRSRQLGILHGLSGPYCELRYLPLDSDIILGDEVVTSGFSEIYPKGILIGRVVKINRQPRGLSLSAIIEPAVDISKLEEVLCVK